MHMSAKLTFPVGQGFINSLKILEKEGLTNNIYVSFGNKDEDSCSIQGAYRFCKKIDMKKEVEYHTNLYNMPFPSFDVVERSDYTAVNGSFYTEFKVYFGESYNYANFKTHPIWITVKAKHNF
jgi:hypothetical protein